MLKKINVFYDITGDLLSLMFLKRLLLFLARGES